MDKVLILDSKIPSRSQVLTKLKEILRFDVLQIAMKFELFILRVGKMKGIYFLNVFNVYR